jgi:peptidoglycan-associated lipoprotein
MRTMKRSVFLNLLLVALIAAVGGTGCKKKTPTVTTIPGTRTKAPGENRPSDLTSGIALPGTPGGTTATSETPLNPNAPIALSNTDDITNMDHDASMFKANSVLFDFDSAAIKSNQREKIQEVASYLKSSSSAGQKMLIDGHCDERGTEEYNRALGERRALAVRKFLVDSGVAADRVHTRSWGEDRPALQGHDEAAWSKNRRGEFILLKPKQ